MSAALRAALSGMAQRFESAGHVFDALTVRQAIDALAAAEREANQATASAGRIEALELGHHAMNLTIARMLGERDRLEDDRRELTAAIAQQRRHADNVTKFAIDWLQGASDRGDEWCYAVIAQVPPASPVVIRYA